MMFIILLIIVFLIIFLPSIDCYKDYRDIRHLVIWYNWFKERKFIHFQWAA